MDWSAEDGQQMGGSGGGSSMGSGFGDSKTTDFDIGDAQVTLFGAVTLGVDCFKPWAVDRMHVDCKELVCPPSIG